MNIKKSIGIDDKVPILNLIPLSFQHAFAMFGSSILIPLLLGIDPTLALLMNGIGTLIYILLTKGRSPAFLGSSSSFIAPALLVIADPRYGLAYALGGFVVVGFVGCIFALIFKKYGTSIIDILLPPAAMGPVVALIGLNLIPFTIRGGKTGADLSNPIQRKIFFITVFVAILTTVASKKIISTLTILIAIIAGYIASLYYGIVDFSSLHSTAFFTIPKFMMAKFSIIPILTILPVSLVVLSEHISHQVVTGNIVGRDLLKDPGLHRSLLGDNISSMLSGLVGSIPTTTFGQNIAVMAITKVYSTRVLAGTAIISILMGFMGYFKAIITSIPGPVIGGVSFLLFGMLGTAGIRFLVDKKVDYSKTKNLILTSVVFISGLSGLKVNIYSVELKGMTLATVVGIILSLLLYLLNREN